MMIRKEERLGSMRQVLAHSIVPSRDRMDGLALDTASLALLHEAQLTDAHAQIQRLRHEMFVMGELLKTACLRLGFSYAEIQAILGDP